MHVAYNLLAIQNYLNDLSEEKTHTNAFIKQLEKIQISENKH